MIDLAPHGAILARFARELETQSPRPLIGLVPDLAAATPDEIEAARLTWAARIVDEFRSVNVFSELLHLLADVEAPFDTLCAVQRLIGDELRHTKLCADVVGWLGGFGGGAGNPRRIAVDLGDLGLPPSDEPAESRALEIVVRELVVAETESVHVLRAYRDACTEPAIHAALAVLLKDEARHAATGRALADVLERTLPRDRMAPFLARRAEVVADDMAYMRAEYLASAQDGPGRALGASLRVEDLAA